MLYLLDANVLIDANRDYYSISRVPEFWEWPVHHGAEARIKIPLEVYEEVKEGNDELAQWAHESETEEALLLDENADPDVVSRVIEDGYAADLTDDEVEQLGRDPFLIAYGFVAAQTRTVVTTEGSKPGRRRANRHIPDVCATVGVQCCDTFAFLRALDFRTGWRS